MIRTKKLSTIRQEIQRSLASGGVDPIQWLEKRIASAKRKGKRVATEREAWQAPRYREEMTSTME